MKIFLAISAALIVGFLSIGFLSISAEASPLREHTLQAARPTMMTDISASRRQHHVRNRHIRYAAAARATRVHVYRSVYRDDYSWFIPYAPPVPHFYPFGYELGYF